MKLRYSTSSPYVRKVLVTAHEAGLADRIELVMTNPWDPETDLGGDNPLGRVPALLLDGGEILYDSPVICEYLDSLHYGVPLFPPSGGARWRALRRMALADGLTDACVLRRVETIFRPEPFHYEPWVDRQINVMIRALDALEREADTFGDQVTIGQVATGCALSYIDFRYPQDEWRPDRPALADWYDGFAGRRSMLATELA